MCTSGMQQGCRVRRWHPWDVHDARGGQAMPASRVRQGCPIRRRPWNVQETRGGGIAAGIQDATRLPNKEMAPTIGVSNTGGAIAANTQGVNSLPNEAMAPSTCAQSMGEATAANIQGARRLPKEATAPPTCATNTVEAHDAKNGVAKHCPTLRYHGTATLIQAYACAHGGCPFRMYGPLCKWESVVPIAGMGEGPLPSNPSGACRCAHERIRTFYPVLENRSTKAPRGEE